MDIVVTMILCYNLEKKRKKYDMFFTVSWYGKRGSTGIKSQGDSLWENGY